MSLPSIDAHGITVMTIEGKLRLTSAGDFVDAVTARWDPHVRVKLPTLSRHEAEAFVDQPGDRSFHLTLGSLGQSAFSDGRAHQLVQFVELICGLIAPQATDVLMVEFFQNQLARVRHGMTGKEISEAWSQDALMFDDEMNVVPRNMAL